MIFCISWDVWPDKAKIDNVRHCRVLCHVDHELLFVRHPIEAVGLTFSFMLCHRCVGARPGDQFVDSLMADERLIVFVGGAARGVIHGTAPVIENCITINGLLYGLHWDRVGQNFSGKAEELAGILKG